MKIFVLVVALVVFLVCPVSAQTPFVPESATLPTATVDESFPDTTGLRAQPEK